MQLRRIVLGAATLCLAAAATNTTPAQVRKASFNLPEPDLEKLRALAKRRDITVTQALREAIADSDFLARQQDEQAEILIRSQDGEVSKVHLVGR